MCHDDHVFYKQNFIIRSQPEGEHPYNNFIYFMQEHGHHMDCQNASLYIQYIQPGSLTQKCEAFRPLSFTW